MPPVFKKIFRIMLPLAAAVSVISASCAGAAETGREYAVKAAFLYNFIRFITWNNDDTALISICAFGNPELLRDLKSVDGRIVNEKKIHVFLESSSAINNVCNIVFISRHDPPDYRKMLQKNSETKGILTISDIEGFAEMGGIIEMFTTEENMIRFKINIKAAARNNLKISSELLKLAVIVEKDN
jgi:hypothetical protein